MQQKGRAFHARIIVPALLAILLAAAFFARPTQFHPYVVFQLTDSLQLTFLNGGQATRGQCEATLNRVTKAFGEKCSTCRVLENRCVDQLDPRQRKLLYGQAVDVPVVRLAGGAMALIGTPPELAWQICKQTELQTARALSGRTECESPAFENLALSLASLSTKRAPNALPKPHALIGITLLALAISFLVCYLIIRSERLHRRFSHDATAGGPQKFHATPTARVGGLALASALVVSIVIMGALGWLRPIAVEGLYLLALAAIPAFAGGLGEDLTKRVGVLARLMLTVAAGVLAALLVEATLDRLDVPGLDAFLHWPVFAVVFTAIAVGGVANAVNIIDGYNGLVGGYAVLVLAAIALVAAQVGDPVVLSASLIMAGALLGFLVWNYPKGRIFLGDGGAYLLGFWLAELSVLLVARNPDVSPWFPLVLLAYPVFETFFSVYRRRILRGGSAGNPDALHLHQLIYLRLARISVGSRDALNLTRRNSKVAGYVWAGTALFTFPALPFYRHTPALIGLAILFAFAYLWLYLRLVRWRAPAWMISSRNRPPNWHTVTTPQDN